MSLPEAIQPDGATHVRYRGRRLIYFGGCDYYRLAHHPKLLKAHAQAAARDGLGTGASRMTTGNHPAHDKLETSLVKFFGSETATVVGDGYLANIALGQAANGRFDAAFIDEKAHMSLRDAAQFIGCPVVRYRHCNADDLARRVSRPRAAKRVLLMTAGVFGATGRVAPVGDLAKRLARSATLWMPRPVSEASGAIPRFDAGRIHTPGTPASFIADAMASRFSRKRAWSRLRSPARSAPPGTSEDTA